MLHDLFSLPVYVLDVDWGVLLRAGMLVLRLLCVHALQGVRVWFGKVCVLYLAEARHVCVWF